MPSGLHAGATRAEVTPETLERYQKIIDWDPATDGEYCRPNGLTAKGVAARIAQPASYGFRSAQRKAVALMIARVMLRKGSGSMTIAQIAKEVLLSRWTVGRTLKAMKDLGKVYHVSYWYVRPRVFSLTEDYRSALDPMA